MEPGYRTENKRIQRLQQENAALREGIEILREGYELYRKETLELRKAVLYSSFAVIAVLAMIILYANTLMYVATLK